MERLDEFLLDAINKNYHLSNLTYYYIQAKLLQSSVFGLLCFQIVASGNINHLGIYL